MCKSAQPASTICSGLLLGCLLLGLLPFSADAQQLADPPPLVPASLGSVVQPATPRGPGDSAPELAPIRPEEVPGESGSSWLSLAELESLAFNRNPTLTQAWARVKRAEGLCLQAGLPTNPTIGYTGEEIGDSGSAGRQGVVIGQTFLMGDKRHLNQEVAYQEVVAAQQRLAAQELRILNDVRQAFYQVLVAQDRVNLAQNIVRLSEQGVDTVRALLEGEEVRRYELVQQQISLQNASIVLDDAIAKQDMAWRKLSALVGAPGLAQVRLFGSVEENLPMLDWDSSLDRALTEGPQMATASAKLTQSRWALQRACAGRAPNVDVEVALLHDDLSGQNLTSVGVELPFPLFNRNQGNIAAARANVRIAEAELDRVALAIQADLAELFAQYELARREVTRYREEILPGANESFEMVRAGYPGQFDFLELLTTQRTYFESHLAYLNGLSRLRESAVAIEGLLLTDNLSVVE